MLKMSRLVPRKRLDSHTPKSSFCQGKITAKPQSLDRLLPSEPRLTHEPVVGGRNL